MHILIIDDQQLFIDGIRHIVNALDDDVDIIEATSAADAIHYMVSISDLDLVLLDLNIPGLDGRSIMQHHRAHSSCPPLVIISGDDDPHTVQSIIDEGARGFIPKSYSGKKLLNSLHTILDGEIYIPEMQKTPGSVQNAKHSYNFTGNGNGNGNGITKRQRQVLELLASGHSNKKISSILFLTENTVKSHVSSLLRTFEASNRTECVNIARNMGIIN